MNSTAPFFIEMSYLTKFDEIIRITINSWEYTIWWETKQRAKRICDDFLDFLIAAYLMGERDAAEMLGIEAETSSDRMYSVIFRVIKGETFEDRVRTHVENNDLPALRILAESEYHRVYNGGEMDGARQAGGGVVKRWNTMKDPRVRDTHDFIEGVEKPLEEEFYTFDGDHAMQPGGFILPENNVNCRCWLTFGYDREVVKTQTETTV